MVQIRTYSTQRCIVDLLCILAFLIFDVYMEMFGPMKATKVLCDDPTLNYEYKGQTISLVEATIGSIVVMIITIAITEVHKDWLDKREQRPRVEKFVVFGEYMPPTHLIYAIKYFMVAFFGALVQASVVSVLKSTTGMHRPVFWSRCNADNETIEFCLENPTASVLPNCTNPSKRAIKEIYWSFPSGHASAVMFVATYMTIYLQYRSSWRPCSSTLPMHIVQTIYYAGACAISATRLTDHVHFLRDVLMGALIGFSAGVLFALYVAEIRQDYIRLNDDMRRVLNYGATIDIERDGSNACNECGTNGQILIAVDDTDADSDCSRPQRQIVELVRNMRKEGVAEEIGVA